MTHTALPPTSTAAPDGLVAALARACGGAVVAPGDPCYDPARRAWQARVDQRPLAVVHPADAAEVAAVLRVAAAAGVPVAPQGTGHNAGPLGDLSGSVLLRTGAMRGIQVDPQAGVARVESGALWVDAVQAIAPHGLMALHGSSPDVGVAGYSLGGGIGWYARALGLQTNSLTAVEVVMADGSVVRADAEHEAELFWALRGGGGNLGVVTALEMRLHPIRSAYAGWLVWDWLDTERVLRRWAAWAGDAPDEVTSWFRILHLPDSPDVPGWLRGRRVAAVTGAVLADDAAAERMLAPLRELRPEVDTMTRQPALDLVRLSGDPEGPTPMVTATTMLADLPEDAVDAVVATAGPASGSVLHMVELGQLGGALSRPHHGGGVLSHLPGAAVAFVGGIPDGEASAAELDGQARAVVSALQPWASNRSYANFTETRSDPSRFYGAEGYARLRAVRDAVDPHRRIRANHPV